MSALERRLTVGAALHHLFVLAGVYLLRPLRDAMGLRGDVRALPWVFVATLAAMVLLQPLYAALVRSWPRRRFVPALYLLITMSLLAFWPALQLWRSAWLARAFFVWASVANLFLVSLFWSLMADLFPPDAGARRYGLVALGGTLGAMAGSALASVLAPRHLLPAMALLLAIATALVQPIVDLRLPAGVPAGPSPRAGLPRSSYLLGVAGWIACYTISSTFAYLLQARLVAGSLVTDAARASLFARMDFAVNALSLALQALATMAILKRLGVGGTLALLPLVTLGGFVILLVAPSLAALVAFQVVRRSTDYAAARPARELLFTVVSRGEKYPAKSFIDTFVYRGGDALGGVLFAGANGGWLALPLCGAWLALTVWLGRRHALARGENLSSTV